MLTSLPWECVASPNAIMGHSMPFPVVSIGPYIILIGPRVELSQSHKHIPTNYIEEQNNYGERKWS